MKRGSQICPMLCYFGLPMSSQIANQLRTLAPRTFEELIAPSSLESFVEHSWNKSFVEIYGDPARFADLCSWDTLNYVLQHHVLRPPMIRLAKNGVVVPPTAYIDTGDPDLPVIDFREMQKRLSLGAMLVLNHVEPLHQPIAELAADLAHTFHGPVTAVFCANFRTHKGFNLHWDDQEAFILQIEGIKHWTVYPPTSAYPFWNSDTVTAPAGEPVFDNVLERGSLLYIPRGWSHVAYPLDEPSLHLTLGIKTPTGIDFLEWLADDLKSQVACRRDLPSLRRYDEKANGAAQILDCIGSACSDPTVLDRFLSDYETRRPARGEVHLPQLCVD